MKHAAKAPVRRFSETAERLFRLSHRETIVNAFDAGKTKYRRIGIFIAAVLIAILYFASPYSLIKGVAVTGNSILSKEYIKQVSGINTEEHFYLRIPFIAEKKLKDDPVIEDASVKWGKDNVMQISVTEKKAVGWRYNGNTPQVLFTDGSSADLKSDYLSIIADVPIIQGFTNDEMTSDLCQAFADVDENVIHNMAEVSQYPLAYDDQAIRVQMRDGTYFLADYYDLFTINEYTDYYAAMKNKNNCLYAFSNNEKNTVFETACPWAEEETEYWTNDDGSIRTNAEGEQIPKHYYTLADGSYALDANGNKIPIPIDENGTEQTDADFQAHYEAGYYSSGSLVIPDDNG